VAPWAHPPGIVDHRWEPETEWHRTWKAFFPVECQKVPHRAENGERHIADVKTAHGHVLEFQNSPISEEERSSREAIYRPMCWVVNGQRLKGDRQKFVGALRLGQAVQANPLTVVVPTQNFLLLRKWENSGTLVLFDFGEIEEESDAVRCGAPVLWASRPGSPTGQAVLMPILRSRFLEAMIKGEPLIGVKSNPPVVRVPNFTTPPPPHRRNPRLIRPRRNWRL
jgi:competence protein CoiA